MKYTLNYENIEQKSFSENTTRLKIYFEMNKKGDSWDSLFREKRQDSYDFMLSVDFFLAHNKNAKAVAYSWFSYIFKILTLYNYGIKYTIS